ncbi:MAG TPA: TIGR03118 family protein [Solirubrobacteraceae bacterium]|jgi:uncharacterized protein (TIGR03118 family)
MTAAARFTRRAGGALLLAGLGAVGVAATAAGAGHANRYKVNNVVSDQAGHAKLKDHNLVNAWGLAQGPSTPIWVANNGTDTATLYSGAVNGSAPQTVKLVVKIPGGEPTGQVFNGSAGYGGAPFIFSSESGRITAWSSGTGAVTKVKRAKAIYKGLAIAGNRLYATDFHNRRVDVFDTSFKRLAHPGFADKRIPKGYAPFGVRAIGGKIYVSYAKQDGDREDDVAGRGHGYVDVFSAKGKLRKRLIGQGKLDSPWGMTVAPKGFGAFGGDLLVGNFGNGAINAYSMGGKFRGRLRDGKGHPITIPGLWGLQFGNGSFGGANGLIFSAGPAGERHGLLGVITAH